MTLLPLALAAMAARAASVPASFAEVAARAKPAVVNLTVTQDLPASEEDTFHFFFGLPNGREEPFGRRGRRWHPPIQGTGSGAVIDPRGYVVTNEHVIRGAETIKVSMTDGQGKKKTYTAKVVGRDPATDLAVVKIQGARDLPHFKLGDSSRIRVGDWALAIGSPFELEQTVTAGIISAVRQSLVIEGRRYYDLLQTDASINRGNSGGPLLNMDGELIGINTAIFSPSGASAGVGFAIPANEVKAVIDELIAGRSVRRGFLGVELAPLDDVLSERFGVSEGALVNSVAPGSSGQKAGIRRGDVVTHLDGRTIDSPEALARAVSRRRPGEKVGLTVVRGRKPETLYAVLGERTQERPAKPAVEAEEPEGAPFRWKGVSFAESPEGAVVARVDADSPLAGHLAEGDLVQGVDQKPVSGLDGLRKAAAAASLEKGVVFDLLRDGKPLFVTVKTGD